MTYYRQISGRDVWVAVQRPLVRSEQSDHYIAKGFSAAYRIDSGPNLLAGEYLRVGKTLRWFTSENEARDAAFSEATRRISSSADLQKDRQAQGALDAAAGEYQVRGEVSGANNSSIKR
jgi:hypothetical protein